MPNKQQGYTGGTFRTVIIANNVTLLSKVRSFKFYLSPHHPTIFCHAYRTKIFDMIISENEDLDLSLDKIINYANTIGEIFWPKYDKKIANL